MLALLVLLLVGCVIVWAAQRLMGAFGIGEPIATVVYVLLVLLFLVALLNAVGLLGSGLSVIHLR